MVTFKNPMFQPLPTSEQMAAEMSNDGCAPAAIFTNENGMVTIRSSRLQQSLSNPSLHLSLPKPDIQKQKLTLSSNKEQDVNNLRVHLNANDILSGLPGIEITKVDKTTDHPRLELDKACQTSEVSIIPSTNREDSEKDDDWTYDNVFTPREVLEDDMDDDELELEAFKRFCQQSIPPKQKEKVAYLNVADIVLKKKSDNFI